MGQMCLGAQAACKAVGIVLVRFDPWLPHQVVSAPGGIGTASRVRTPLQSHLMRYRARRAGSHHPSPRPPGLRPRHGDGGERSSKARAAALSAARCGAVAQEQSAILIQSWPVVQVHLALPLARLAQLAEPQAYILCVGQVQVLDRAPAPRGHKGSSFNRQTGHQAGTYSSYSSARTQRTPSAPASVPRLRAAARWRCGSTPTDPSIRCSGNSSTPRW